MNIINDMHTYIKIALSKYVLCACHCYFVLLTRFITKLESTQCSELYGEDMHRVFRSDGCQWQVSLDSEGSIPGQRV